jgi:uncharacterized RDD family membrane protein YckC
MTEVPPTGGDGAPDDSQDPHAPTPPPYPGGSGPPPAVPPVPAPPPPAPPGSMPPPTTSGTWPGQVPPPGGAFPYGGARPPGDGGYVPPPYGAPGYGAPAYGSGEYGPGSSGALAGYGARLGGRLIDFLILLVVAAIVLIPLHAIRHDHVIVHGTTSYRYHVNGVGLLFWVVMVIVYGGLLCGSARGQTVGMMVTHTRAVNAADGSSPIGYPRAFGRAAFEYLMAFPLFFLVPWIVDMLFPLWDSKNQTLHDKVTNTVVIRV